MTSTRTKLTRRRAAALPGLLPLLLGLAGCSAPWIVIRQAAPNPLVGTAQFTALPLVFDGLRVGSDSEMAYLATMDADDKKAWAEDKAAMNELFLDALRKSADDDGIAIVDDKTPSPYFVQGHITFIEPGFYAYVAAQPSETRMTVTVSTAEGEVVDEIEISHQTNATISNAAVGNRLRADAKAIGRDVADYLSRRIRPR